MKRIALVVLAVGMLVTISHAETLVSPSGGKWVILFNSENNFKYYANECTGKNQAFQKDCIACVKSMILSGTKCSVISGGALKKIKITTGTEKGKIGWVPREMIQ